MIKINLANSLLKGQQGGLKSESSAESKQLRENIVKGALILLPVMGLFFYEKRFIASKQEQLASVQTQKMQLDEKLTQIGNVDEIVQQDKQQRAELERKAKVMQSIFSMRMQKLKTIIALQTHIPRGAWLEKINFEDQDIAITGYSSNTEDVQTFASLLSQEKDLFSSFSTKGVNAEKHATDSKAPEIFKFEFKGKLRE